MLPREAPGVLAIRVLNESVKALREIIMKKANLSYILVALMLLAAAGGQAVSVERQRKARHFALAAMQAATEGDMATSHELYKRAYALDPDNKSVAYSLALGNLTALSDDDTVALANALNMMRDYVDSYPGDYNEGAYYAYLRSMVGDVPEAIRVTRRIADLRPNRSEPLSTLAGYYMQNGQPDSAIAYYSRFEQLEGLSPELLVRKSLIYLMQGDTVSALEEAGAMIRKNPLSAGGYLIKASLFEHLDYQDSAMNCLLRAAEIEPDNGTVKLSLAEHYRESGDSVSYDKYVYEALLSEDLDVSDKLEILAVYIQPRLQNKEGNERDDKLIDALRNQYPHDPKIQLFAAQTSYERGRYEDAAEQIGIAIDMDPERVEFHRLKIMYQLMAKQYEQAIATFEALPDSMAADPSTLYLGASAYTMLNRPDDALKAAGKMLSQLSPGMSVTDTLTDASLTPLSSVDRKRISETYTLIGDTYAKMKNIPMMELAYTNALTADPYNAETLNNYAYFLSLEKQGDLEKAERMIEKAIEMMPDFGTYLDTYAWVLFRKGDYKKALEIQQKALEATSEDDMSGELYEHMGDILFMNAEPGRALEMWEKALPLDPDNALLKRKIKYKTYFYE